MGDFLLLDKAVDILGFQNFKNGMLNLALIEKALNDSFLKNPTIYNLREYANLFSNFGQEEQFISDFIEKLAPTGKQISTELELEEFSKTNQFAFLGIDFKYLGITLDKQIKDDISYKKFKNLVLWNVNSRTLFQKSKELFPNLILCGAVEQQLSLIGDGSYFSQIVDRLKELNRAAGDWKSNNFDHRKVNNNYSLNISPESKQTMDNHGEERLFKLPNGKQKHFELHVKTGDFRFHFYPDNSNHIIYVGYIGPHLRTWTN